MTRLGGIRPCVECGEHKPIQANERCNRCYQRAWNRERRHVPKAQRPALEVVRGGSTLYPQAIVRGIPKGWGAIS